ncbi:MAG TPA: hypothetical protein VL426_06355 [Candidatus Binatia bacterium]|nr:hypothetical protein [Candidatus Binatia bacterium]
MKRFGLFVLLLALAAADIGVVRAGLVPGWWLVAAFLLGAAAIVTATLAIVAETSACQLCGKPLADRRAAGDYALRFGLRACGECGPKLEERFGDEEPVDRRPFPPSFP